MRRIALLAAAVLSAAAALAMASSASAALFPECPPVELNQGCQFLVNVTDTETTIESDSTQGPYEGADDALVGVVNHSSKAITSLPLSAETELFGFEQDGLCAVKHPEGACFVMPENVAGEPELEKEQECPPASGPCAVKEAAGEPAKTEFPEALVTAGLIQPIGRYKDGSEASGYEGPGTWFSGIGAFHSFATGTGVINFGPAIPPGGTAYFTLESPPAGGFGSASTLTTSLTGGAASGPSISVNQGTPVFDTATLGGENAATANGGTVTFGIFSDPACTAAVPGISLGSAKLAGGVAKSGAVAPPVGTYYFRASFGGNAEHQAISSECNESLKVLSPTTTTTAQTGAGLTGPSLTMPQGTGVTDKAAIAGALAKAATGTVTYTLYSDAKCTKPFAASAAAVAAGVAGPSAAVKPKPGTYYWVASYSGDASNGPSSSPCGSEVLLVGLNAKLGLPALKGCYSLRKFIAHPHAPHGVKLVRFEMLINGKKVPAKLDKRHTTITLSGRPKGTFHVTMIATDSKGRKYVDIRTYHTCVPKKHHKKK
jgi:hypothetical protein